jgi:hypothetical protein
MEMKDASVGEPPNASDTSVISGTDDLAKILGTESPPPRRLDLKRT